MPDPRDLVTRPCGWCGRPGRRRHHTERAFGRVVVADPVLCDVCHGLVGLVPGTAGQRLHDSARELVLDALGQHRPLPDDAEPQPTRTFRLRAERDQARAIARVLADELASHPALAGEAAILMATLPTWVQPSRHHDGRDDKAG